MICYAGAYGLVMWVQFDNLALSNLRAEWPLLSFITEQLLHHLIRDISIIKYMQVDILAVIHTIQ